MSRLLFSLLILSVVNFSNTLAMLPETLGKQSKLQIENTEKLQENSPKTQDYSPFQSPRFSPIIIERLLKSQLIKRTSESSAQVHPFYLWTFISSQSAYLPLHIWHLILIWSTLRNSTSLNIDELALDEFLAYIAHWNIDKIKQCLKVAHMLAQSQQAAAIEKVHLTIACTFTR